MVALGFLLLGIVPTFESWDEAVHEAKQNEVSVVVLYLSRSDCTFCRRFEIEVLKPVLASGFYEDIAIREIVLDQTQADLNLPFASTATELQASYNVVGTPTMLFLSIDGEEVARRVTGYRGDDYAHYRLERSLKHALGYRSE